MIGRAARLAAGAGAVLVLAACAGSPKSVATLPKDGYLSAGVLSDMAAAIPAPPTPGSPQDAADKAASARYAALEDGDRWLLATSHAEGRPPLAPQHFDCALGVRLGSAETPVLDRMMGRLFHDAASVAEQVKARQMRPRPVAGRSPAPRLPDPGRGRAAQRLPIRRAARRSASPMARCSRRWSRIVPRPVRRIGHQIGISRLVCAMHYPSDVAAGEAIGRQVAARAIADPAFQADMAAARAELAAARRTGLTNPGCAAERAALATVLP